MELVGTDDLSMEMVGIEIMDTDNKRRTWMEIRGKKTKKIKKRLARKLRGIIIIIKKRKVNQKTHCTKSQ